MTGKTLKNFALMSAWRSTTVTSVIVSLTIAAGCTSQSGPSLGPSPPLALHHLAHVVVIVQENRSFDNLFSGFAGADAPRFGYDGRRRIALRPTPLEDPGNIENNWRDAIAGWNNGKMDGFASEHFYGGPLDYAYGVVPRAESAPYWAMAKQYVLADHMFPMEFGPALRRTSV